MATLIPYYYSHSNCGKIRIIIAPFGYGPKVAAETMAKLLNISIGEWKINSTSAIKNKFDVTFNFGVSQPINEPKTSYKIWVDCLMWLRNKIPKKVRNYDLFLAENFFDTNPSLLSQIENSKLKNIIPLYSLNGYSNFNNRLIQSNENNHILVSFGGVETPFTTDVHRFIIPEIVLKSLLTASQKFNDKRKIVCCLPLNLLSHFKNTSDFSDVDFKTPNHEEFLKILNNASIYIVQPGLYGPFESFECGIPTAIITPFSYTQVCQTKKYVETELSGYIPMWNQLNTVTGDLNGNIEFEEEFCFQKISNWINENNITSNNSIYLDWAEKVLKGTIVTTEITLKRMNYVKQCRSLSVNSFQNILIKK